MTPSRRRVFPSAFLYVQKHGAGGLGKLGRKSKNRFGNDSGEFSCNPVGNRMKNVCRFVRPEAEAGTILVDKRGIL